MERIDFKPLGTVVGITGTDKKFMIVARAISIKLNGGEKSFFDYGGVIYPEGLIGNNIVYFQDNDISDVVFEGYADSRNQDYVDRLWSRLSSENMKHADVKKLQEENYRRNTRSDR